MVVYVIQKIEDNDNYPNSINAMVNYHYHGESRVINNQFPSMIGNSTSGSSTHIFPTCIDRCNTQWVTYLFTLYPPRLCTVTHGPLMKFSLAPPILVPKQIPITYPIFGFRVILHGCWFLLCIVANHKL